MNGVEDEQFRAQSGQSETAAQDADEALMDTGEADATGAASADDLLVLADRIATLEAELAEVSEKWKRALAETENVRRIAQRDREDAGKYAVTRFARDMLSVADNLRRALDSMDPDARQIDDGLDALAGGVELTERELLATLARYGITPIAAAAEPFDPHVHEALFEVPDESVPHGTVVHVLEPGYMIHDRPLRPARVGVSKGGPRAVAQPSGGGAGESAGSTAAEADGLRLDEQA